MINIDNLEKNVVAYMIWSGFENCNKYKKALKNINEFEFTGFNRWIVKAVKKIVQDTNECPTLQEVENFLEQNITKNNLRNEILGYLVTEIATFQPATYNTFEYYLNLLYKQKALIKLAGV